MGGIVPFIQSKGKHYLPPEIEGKINKFLNEGHEILRKQDEKNPYLWWWSCGAWNMPCGGTHVKATGEIGKLYLKRRNLGAGKERVEMFLRE